MKIIYIFILCLILSTHLFAQKQKVIFDCDLGGDIDDAYALALLLTSLDEIDLLGIVLDHGRTEARAKVAAKILSLTGQENIPIYVGRETKRNLQTDTVLASYDRQLFWAKDFTGLIPKNESASEFIINSLHKYPNEIILFTVGPIPNIGEILTKDKDVLKLAKRIVSMFGSFYTGYNGSATPSIEYNVAMDLKSSQMFSNSGANITYIGLDVTDHIKLNSDERLQLFMRGTPLTDALSSLYSLWRGEWGPEWVTPTLYDVVTVAYVIWPDLFKTEKVNVSVNDEGYTIINKDLPSNSKVALKINEELFLKRFMEKMLLQNLGQSNFNNK